MELVRQILLISQTVFCAVSLAHWRDWTKDSWLMKMDKAFCLIMGSLHCILSVGLGTRYVVWTGLHFVFLLSNFLYRIKVVMPSGADWLWWHLWFRYASCS